MTTVTIRYATCKACGLMFSPVKWIQPRLHGYCCEVCAKKAGSIRPK